MGGIVLLAQRPAWRAAMSPLASVGRMPLTNYLMQSVIASTLFYGYAFGLYYRIGPAVGVLIAFAIYAVQVAYSAWWMARFRFGPMEWLWRSLTYGKAPAILTPAPRRWPALSEVSSGRIEGELLDGADAGSRRHGDYAGTLTWRNVVLTPAELRKYVHPSQATPAGALSHHFHGSIRSRLS